MSDAGLLSDERLFDKGINLFVLMRARSEGRVQRAMNRELV